MHDVLLANDIIRAASSAPHTPVNIDFLARNAGQSHSRIGQKLVNLLHNWNEECNRLVLLDELVCETERRLEMRPWEREGRALWEEYVACRALRPSQRDLVVTRRGPVADIEEIRRMVMARRSRVARRGVSGDSTVDGCEDPPPPYSDV